MARKIGAELIHYWTKDEELVEKNMRLMKKVGFEACFFPLLLDEKERMERYLALADELGLEIDELHESTIRTNDIWNEDESGDVRCQAVLDAVDFCAEHGVKKMVMHDSSSQVAPVMSDAGMARLRKILEYANAKDVLICFENVHRPQYMARIMYENRDLKVGYCWDTGHELCYNPGIEHLVLFGDKLACTHVHDNRGIYYSDDHLLPFDGVNDWERDAELIRKSGYKGIISGELKRDAEPYKHLSDEEFCKLAYERMKKFVDMCDAE